MFIKKLRTGYNEALQSQIEFETKEAELWQGEQGKSKKDKYTHLCENVKALRALLEVSSIKPCSIDTSFSRKYQQDQHIHLESIINAIVDVAYRGATTGNFEG
jgi:hypothetical protein